jgi:hypothetical protein
MTDGSNLHLRGSSMMGDDGHEMRGAVAPVDRHFAVTDAEAEVEAGRTRPHVGVGGRIALLQAVAERGIADHAARAAVAGAEKLAVPGLGSRHSHFDLDARLGRRLQRRLDAAERRHGHRWPVRVGVRLERAGGACAARAHAQAIAKANPKT